MLETQRWALWPDEAHDRHHSAFGLQNVLGRLATPLIVSQHAVNRDAQPRPMKGIFVAITVMNCTLAFNGRLAM